jgi:hypothetical protein
MLKLDTTVVRSIRLNKYLAQEQSSNYLERTFLCFDYYTETSAILVEKKQ